MADSSQILNDAYQYIEDGDFQAARELLEEHRTENENNPDFWWVYAHAVETDEEGQAALQRLLELDPEYPGARTLLSQLTPRLQPQPVPAAVPPPPPVDEPGDNFDDFPEDDFADSTTEERTGRTRTLLIAAVAVLALVVVGALLLPGLLTSTPDETPTAAIAEEPTARPLVDDLTELVEPSDEPAVISPTSTVTSAPVVEDGLTEESPTDATATEDEDEVPSLFATQTRPVDPTEESDDPTRVPLLRSTSTREPVEEETEDVSGQTSEEDTSPILATPTRETALPTDTASPTETPAFGLDAVALNEVGIPEDGLVLEETTLGNTLVLTVCALPGPQASAAIAEILDVIVDDLPEVDSEVEAFGFRITDCGDNTVFRTIGIGRASFEDGTTEDIQSALRPIN